jgi:hypothetical protein
MSRGNPFKALSQKRHLVKIKIVYYHSVSARSCGSFTNPRKEGGVATPFPLRDVTGL